MMTFRKLTAAGAGKLIVAYLREQQVEPERDVRTEANKTQDVETGDRLNSYYTGREGRGAWAPHLGDRIASQLGIDIQKPPTDEGLARLFECKRADNGQGWSNHGRKRELCGFDFTAAPAKSVTLAAEFAPTREEQALIWHAIHQANDAAMAFVAKEVGVARRGSGDGSYIEEGETAWVSFRHYTARPAMHIQDGPGGATASVEIPVPGDPQAHIHNIMLNAVATESGHLGSLDSARITKATAHLYGAVFQADLAQRLRDVGIKVKVDARGKAVEIEAVPTEVCEAFSKRSKQAESRAKAFVREQGGDWKTMSADQKFKVLHQANLAFRSKKYTGDNEREIWREEAAEMNWTHQSVLTEAPTRAIRSDAERLEQAYAIAARMIAEEYKTAAVIDLDVFRTHAAHGLIEAGMKETADIARVADMVIERGIDINGERVRFLQEEQEGRWRVTTSQQVALEQKLAKLAGESARTREGALSEEAITQAIAASGLDFESNPDHGHAQLAAIRAMGRAGGLAFTTGAAGAGKTAILKPLVGAWQQEGGEVIGTAMAWRQADALKDAGVTRTYAMATLLSAAAKGEVALRSKDVLVIDEVSQVAPRQLLTLLELQARQGFAIRLLGDREQAQAIEAGDAVELLNRVLPPEARPEILGTIRQATAQGRRIAGLFRSAGRDLTLTEDEQRRVDIGRAREAIDLKRKAGTLSLVGGDHQQVVDQIADLYLRRRDMLAASGSTRGITLSAPTNSDVADLSLAVRSRLKARGEIGTEETIRPAVDQRGDTYDLPIAVGDRLRLFSRTSCQVETARGKRWRELGSNGDFVDVEGWSDKGLHLRNRKGQSGFVPWERLLDAGTHRLRLGFGHAMTIDAAQGMTSDEHINAMPRGSSSMTGFTSYVAETRHVHRCYTMVAEAPLREAETFSRALGDKAPITLNDLYDRLAGDMGRHPYKAMGVDLVKAELQGEKQRARWIRQNHLNETARQAGKTPGAGFHAQQRDKQVREVPQARWDDISRRMRKAAYETQASMARLDQSLQRQERQRDREIERELAQRQRDRSYVPTPGRGR